MKKTKSIDDMSVEELLEALADSQGDGDHLFVIGGNIVVPESSKVTHINGIKTKE
jgi:hypothetical protein